MWKTQVRVWISQRRKMWSKEQSLLGTEISHQSIHFFWNVDHIQELFFFFFVHFTNPTCIF